MPGSVEHIPKAKAKGDIGVGLVHSRTCICTTFSLRRGELDSGGPDI